MSQPGTTATAGPDSVRDEAEIRRVAGASLIGSVVEWYDFFLYGTMAALVFNASSSRSSTRSPGRSPSRPSRPASSPARSAASSSATSATGSAASRCSS